MIGDKRRRFHPLHPSEHRLGIWIKYRENRLANEITIPDDLRNLVSGHLELILVLENGLQITSRQFTGFKIFLAIFEEAVV